MENYVDKFKKITSTLDLSYFLDEITLAAGYSQYRLAVVFPTKHVVRPKAVIYSNCSPAWVDIYASKGFASQDPIIYLAMNNTTPIVWSELPPFNELPSGSEIVMNEAKNFGLENGISFPLRGPRGEFGVFSFITDDPAILINPNSPHLSNIANYALDAVIRTSGKGNHSFIYQLNERELSCLFWVAEGKTTHEISVILGVSERMARFYLDSSVKKLGASNRVHAAIIASMVGLISPEMRFVEIDDRVSNRAK